MSDLSIQKAMPATKIDKGAIEHVINTEHKGAIEHVDNTEYKGAIEHVIGDIDSSKKIFPTDTVKKLPIFDDLKTAKALIGDILASKGDPFSNKGGKAEMQFQKLINSMSDDELIELANHINDLMTNTDGQDETLGRLQNMVLNEIGDLDFNRYSPIPIPFKPPHGIPPFMDTDGDGFTNVKYACVFSTRDKIIK